MAALELASKIPVVRGWYGGKLENARIVESLTALVIGLNMRYKVHGAGIRFTGPPTESASAQARRSGRGQRVGRLQFLNQV